MNYEEQQDFRMIQRLATIFAILTALALLVLMFVVRDSLFSKHPDSRAGASQGIQSDSILNRTPSQPDTTRKQ